MKRVIFKGRKARHGDENVASAGIMTKGFIVYSKRGDRVHDRCYWNFEVVNLAGCKRVVNFNHCFRQGNKLANTMATLVVRLAMGFQGFYGTT
ncbi:hypothetical protein V6N11_076321 [Hibiscus sabdariffa]|uniref:Uncharacterized protein n=2 Tax=Hibiscus sabdariffa TaxID=183260 RepID=A0ABR2ATI9_9ROSI